MPSSGAPPQHLLHVFPTFAVGGSQIRFAQLVRLHGDRYRHTVIAIDGVRSMAERLTEPAVTCLEERFKTRSPLSGIVQARQRLLGLKPDILVTYNWGAMDWCAARLLSPVRRHVHIEDGFGPDEASGPKWRRSLFRRAILGAGRSTVVVPSLRLKALAAQGWGISPRRLRHIPNGIDLARFAEDLAPPDSTRPFTIGTVATLRREKNIARLIDLFAKFRRSSPGEARLLIVGDGPERSALEACAAASNAAGEIVFAGSTARPEMFLRQMDVFALSSDTEQMPLSILEAMAGGLPVVSFDVGDVRYMVARENLPYAAIPPVDDDAFVSALVTLRADPAMRVRIGAANRSLAIKSYDERSMADAYAAVFG